MHGLPCSALTYKIRLEIRSVGGFFGYFTAQLSSDDDSESEISHRYIPI